jgi:hypothetical protein
MGTKLRAKSKNTNRHLCSARQGSLPAFFSELVRPHIEPSGPWPGPAAELDFFALLLIYAAFPTNATIIGFN